MRLGLSMLALLGMAPPMAAAAQEVAHLRLPRRIFRPGFLERRNWRMARSPDGQRVALIAPRGSGEALHVDGRPLYPRAGGCRIVSPPVWSPDGRGIAVLERLPGGALQLVAFLDTADRPVTWDLPDLGYGLRPIWLGKQRMAVGKSELSPMLIVSWTDVLVSAP